MKREDTKKMMADAAAAAQAGQAGDTGKRRRAPLAQRSTLLAPGLAGRVENRRRLSVLPEQCRMWGYHNRFYDLLTPESCANLIASIEAEGGQKIPAIVRPLDEPDGEIEFEVIAGARRHFAVSHLRAAGRDDVYFLIEPVPGITDEEAFRLSDIENREREDLSDYERAADYERALRTFYSGSIPQMATAIGMKEYDLRRFISITDIPQFILDGALDVRGFVRDHGERIKQLRKAISDDALENAASTAVKAKGRLKAGDLVRMLEQAAKPKGRGGKTERAIISQSGKKVGTFEVTARSLTLKVPRTKGQDAEAVARHLEQALLEITDPKKGDK